MKRKGAALTRAEARGSQPLNGANRLLSFVIEHRKYMYFLSCPGATKIASKSAHVQHWIIFKQRREIEAKHRHSRQDGSGCAFPFLLACLYFLHGVCKVCLCFLHCSPSPRLVCLTPSPPLAYPAEHQGGHAQGSSARRCSSSKSKIQRNENERLSLYISII